MAWLRNQNNHSRLTLWPHDQRTRFNPRLCPLTRGSLSLASLRGRWYTNIPPPPPGQFPLRTQTPGQFPLPLPPCLYSNINIKTLSCLLRSLYLFNIYIYINYDINNDETYDEICSIQRPRECVGIFVFCAIITYYWVVSDASPDY